MKKVRVFIYLLFAELTLFTILSFTISFFHYYSLHTHLFSSAHSVKNVLIYKFNNTKRAF